MSQLQNPKGNKEAEVEVKVKLSLCIINKALSHEGLWGSRGTVPPFLTSAVDGSEWVASPPYPFDRRLGGPQSQYGRYGIEKSLLPLPGIKLRPFSPQSICIPAPCIL
jgi:hypothetical protein